MAEVVRSLVVELTFKADASELQGFNSASGESVTGSVAMGTAIGNAATLFAKFGLQAVKGAANALKDLIGDQVDARDNIAKTSAALGIQAEGFQELTFAAEQSGGSQGDIEKGLFTLQRQLDAASSGSQEAVDAFNTLGISQEELARSFAEGDAVGAFKTFAEGFAATEQGAGKTAAALATFGRAGKNLGPLLDQGTEGVQALVDEADELGNVFGGDSLKKFEDFADAQNRVSTQLDGVKGRIVEAVLPAMEQFVGTLQGLLEENDQLISQDIPMFIEAIAEAATVIIPIVAEWTKEAATLFRQWEQLMEEMEDSDTTIGSVADSALFLAEGIESITNAAIAGIKAVTGLGAAIKILGVEETESLKTRGIGFKGEAGEIQEARQKKAKDAKESRKKEKQEQAKSDAEGVSALDKFIRGKLKVQDAADRKQERDAAATARRLKAARDKAKRARGAGGKKDKKPPKGGAIGLKGRKSITADELFKLGELFEEEEAEATTGGAIGAGRAEAPRRRSPPTFSRREGRGASAASASSKATVINAPFTQTVNVVINVEGGRLDLGADGQGAELANSFKRSVEDNAREVENHFQRTVRK